MQVIDGTSKFDLGKGDSNSPIYQYDKVKSNSKGYLKLVNDNILRYLNCCLYTYQGITIRPDNHISNYNFT